MNIVIITILLPYPLTSGGAQAQFTLIDQLRKRHHISIIFPQNGDNTLYAMRSLQRMWPDVNFYPYLYAFQLLQPSFFLSKIRRAYQLKYHALDRQFMVERLLLPYGYPTSEHFYKFIHKVISDEHADIVQTEFYPFLRLIHHLPDSVRRVFVHHEIRYIRNRRLLSPIRLEPKEEQWLEELKEEEVRDLNRYDDIIALTAVDKSILLQMGVVKPIHVSPATVTASSLDYTPWNGKLVFVGGRSHTPNQEGIDWLFREVLPLIDWSLWPQVELDIIGIGWSTEYESKIPHLKVRCLGFVESLKEVAYGAVMLVPILSGSGMRMKLVEAAAMSMPIITTSVGAEGLRLQHGESAMLANSALDWKDSLIAMMSSSSLRKQLAMNAHQLYLKYYSPEALALLREQVYEKL